MNNNFIKQLRENSAAIGAYLQALSVLHEIGMLNFLRDAGRVLPVSPDTQNYVEYQNALANQAIGFNRALDYLINFKDLFLDAHETPNVPLDFGALEEALDKGDLTKEEYDAIRRGEQPVYPATSNLAALGARNNGKS